MGKKFNFFLLLILLNSLRIFGQVVPSAEGPGLSVYVGGEASTFNPDWGCAGGSPLSCWSRQLIGIGVFGDANHVIYNFGVEGEARWLHWRGMGQGLVESNYLVGPRYKLFQRGKFSGYGKLLLGGGWITLPADVGHGSYFDLAPGGTIEYRAARKLTLRGDYEYQIWPAFSGIPAAGTNGLTPNGFSVGASYRVWH